MVASHEWPSLVDIVLGTSMRPAVASGTVNCTSTLGGSLPKQKVVPLAGRTRASGLVKAAIMDSPKPEQQDDCAVAAICSVKGLGDPAVGPAGQR